MKSLLLLDIDKTLFDTEKFTLHFSNIFCKFLKIPPEKLNKVLTKYRKSQLKHTDYNPEEFIKHLINSFHLDKQPKIYEKLHNLYFAPENFTKNIFPDTNILVDLKKRYSLGIYTEGFPSYQKTKLVKSNLYDLFDPKNIFIFRRKTTPKSLIDLPDQATIVDDDPKVIQELLDQKTKIIYPIWLNRKTKDKHPHARTIHSLTEII
jgi:hypothetical protein